MFIVEAFGNIFLTKRVGNPQALKPCYNDDPSVLAVGNVWYDVV